MREIEARRLVIPGWLSDALFFTLTNVKHYSFALLGFRLRLDPDYRIVTRFFPNIITDTVFEYRTYGILPLWGVAVAWALDGTTVLPWAIVALWAILARRRAYYFTSPLAFYRQAFKESPRKARIRNLYFEELVRETERQSTQGGKSWEELGPMIEESRRVQDATVEIFK